jgi:hypothetical protein
MCLYDPPKALESGLIPVGGTSIQLLGQSMSPVFNYLAPIAVGAVALVLLLGLFNLARGGSSERSQMLMRWRVGLQLLAVVIVMTALYLGSR